MKKAHKTARFGALLLTAAIILFSACGRDQGPLAPELRDVIEPLPMPAGLPILGATVVSEEIGQNGGVLQLDFCTLIIPEGALNGATEISITRDDPAYATVEFSPDGQRFDAPVEMLFEIEIFEQFMADEGLAPDDLVVGLYDSEMGRWIPLETQVKVVGDESYGDDVTLEPGTYISAMSPHFSRYALSF